MPKSEGVFSGKASLTSRDTADKKFYLSEMQFCHLNGNIKVFYKGKMVKEAMLKKNRLREGLRNPSDRIRLLRAPLADGIFRA